MYETGKPKRRIWFQFRLRTLLVAVLVLSLPLSWFSARMERASRQREAVKVIERLGGWVDEFEEPSVPRWIRACFPEDFFMVVVEAQLVGTQITNTEHLKELTDLEKLSLICTQIPDAGFEHLKGLTNLEELNLTGTPITDAGLEHLKGLATLERLYLHDTQVTDAGLKHLKELSKLKILVVYNTNTTPEGVKELQAALPQCKID